MAVGGGGAGVAAEVLVVEVEVAVGGEGVVMAAVVVVVKICGVQWLWNCTKLYPCARGCAASLSRAASQYHKVLLSWVVILQHITEIRLAVGNLNQDMVFIFLGYKKLVGYNVFNLSSLTSLPQTTKDYVIVTLAP